MPSRGRGPSTKKYEPRNRNRRNMTVGGGRSWFSRSPPRPMSDEDRSKNLARFFLANKIRYYENLRLAFRKLRNLRSFYEKKIGDNMDSEPILWFIPPKVVDEIYRLGRGNGGADIELNDLLLMINGVGKGRSFLYGEHVYDFFNGHPPPSRTQGDQNKV